RADTACFKTLIKGSIIMIGNLLVVRISHFAIRKFKKCCSTHRNRSSIMLSPAQGATFIFEELLGGYCLEKYRSLCYSHFTEFRNNGFLTHSSSPCYGDSLIRSLCRQASPGSHQADH